MQTNDSIYLVIKGPVTQDEIKSMLGFESKRTIDFQGIPIFHIALSEDDSSGTGELRDWCGVLFEKKAELDLILNKGCSAELRCVLVSVEVEIDSETIQQLAKFDIPVSIWLKSGEPNDLEFRSPHQLVIPEPLLWYSQRDENQFFNSLLSIFAIKSFIVRPGKPLQDIPNELILMLDEPFMDDYSLRDLIALMYRYSLDMTCLSQQCTHQNAHWFKNPKMFWYQNIFGSGSAD